MTDANSNKRHCLAVLVDNEPGVLARVIGLFSGRGYNIESLSVAEVDGQRRVSRITVVTCGDDAIVEQIMAQLDRLVPVHKVINVSRSGAWTEREMALIKVGVEDGARRAEILKLAKESGGQPLDAGASPLILCATGSPDAVDALISSLRPFGVMEIARTGSVGMGTEG